ncbi:sensor domain-containing protein [Mycolicibacterium sp. 018/SC-01/001]|uniref:sensor domain-containing protein n=1 Tax=Mycolicibacterium sp. 018/SC-01/001 TaxID=2592069 RepID=UPI0011813BAE|nr:sensor domain-containing protein [Mycolicibacterium sp. 018/SC-01/001]TRW88364.1 sensor domain-containing protein [Mycolicibacterium sp. 018/SC-01/001]
MSTKLAATACACLVVAGCASAPVDNRPVVRIAEAARPAPMEQLGRFLPTSQELATVLGAGSNAFIGQPVEGGPEALLRTVAAGQAAPLDCVGTAYRLQKVTYDGSPVRSVATNSWAGGSFDGPPVTGFFGVVQMADPAAAQTFFAESSNRWQQCNGQTVTREQTGAGEISRIADVAFENGVTRATVLHAAGGAPAATAQRAIALAGDCIVDVEITDPRPDAASRQAVGVADLIADKITTQR